SAAGTLRLRATPAATKARPARPEAPAIRSAVLFMSDLDLDHAEDDGGADGDAHAGEGQHGVAPALEQGLHVAGADRLHGEEKEDRQGAQHPGRDATL